MKRQHSFWGNIDHATNVAAQVARDAFYRRLKAEGKRNVRRTMEPNKRRRDGREGNLYFVTWEE